MAVVTEEAFQDKLAEISFRRKVVEVMGTAAERRALRKRLGFTRADVAEMTGLSAEAIRLRELPEWQIGRSSFERDASWNYILFVLAAKGLKP
jgi:hypothetical protein